MVKAGGDIDISGSSNRFENRTLEKNPYISWFNDFFSIAYKENFSNRNSQSSGIDSIGTFLRRNLFSGK